MDVLLHIALEVGTIPIMGSWDQSIFLTLKTSKPLFTRKEI